ncbi:MAG: tetratricopeptide repeat protein [Desulfobacter sp.]|nr:tetratricopeptide repeat protein [Desulfobacter sp.]
MMKKFTSKEIHFLKTGSETQPLFPPETYLSDLLHSPSIQFTAFEQRMAQTKIVKDNFIAAVIQIDARAPEKTREKARDIFEACFHSVLDKERGIWESLDTMTFILVFWDYKDKQDGTRLLTLLKDKISAQLKADLLMGLAPCPFHDFTQDKILGNALKAIDHAAFFGPGHMITFDAVSLNISGDRLYQLKKYEQAIQEYESGLAIEPQNINLINSLGVAYGITGQLDKALNYFEQASAISPEEVMVIYNIGLIHRINENEKKAMVYLRKAHGINPEIFEIELLLGHLLFKQDQYDQAMVHLSAAVRLNPESGAAFRMKGQIFLYKKETASAGAQFNLAVKLNPQDATALSGYAKAMVLERKNLSIALSFAKKSVALDPDNPTFSRRLEKIQEIHDQAQSQRRGKTIKSA